MNKLPDDIVHKIQAQMEVATRYKYVMPLDQQLALTAIRLFMSRFGYDQIVSNIKTHGSDRMAKAAQHELKVIADTWNYAIEIEPPPPEKLPYIRADMKLVDAAATSPDVNARIHKIMARLQLRDDMIQNRKNSPPQRVQ